MIRTVRAAGFAAAALGFAASILFGGPLSAGPSQAASAAVISLPGTLAEQVAEQAGTLTADAEQDCLASAVYFEARGEPIEGQLAVADVVLNRVASSRYPDTICEVVEQPWQFSFVNRTGSIPQADRSSEAWRKAVAIARIAQAGTARAVDSDVLWYHAEYVSPSWGTRLARQDKIGLHIFYS
jgi:spore germination cell wall hydrolase CwlJ-like protein